MVSELKFGPPFWDHTRRLESALTPRGPSTREILSMLVMLLQSVNQFQTFVPVSIAI